MHVPWPATAPAKAWNSPASMYGRPAWGPPSRPRAPQDPRASPGPSRERQEPPKYDSSLSWKSNKKQYVINVFDSARGPDRGFQGSPWWLPRAPSDRLGSPRSNPGDSWERPGPPRRPPEISKAAPTSILAVNCPDQGPQDNCAHVTMRSSCDRSRDPSWGRARGR